MFSRWLTALLLSVAAAPAVAQTAQYRSPFSGVTYRSLADTGAIARAEAALAQDPTNVDLFIALGLAQSSVWQFQEAITTFTRGLAVSPKHPMLLRWRGHRYMSVRQFDRAAMDFEAAARIDPSIYGVWYHLGVLKFTAADYVGAVTAFKKALPLAPDAGERAGATDWLWMSLSRAGRRAEARALLARRPDSLPTANQYAQRLKLYRGQIKPEALITPADTAAVALTTLSYGLGNWYMVRGDKVKAREWFERTIASGGWPAFGFIVAERELARLK